MFQIAISPRFIDIINKSWHQLQTFDRNLKTLFKKAIVANIALF